MQPRGQILWKAVGRISKPLQTTTGQKASDSFQTRSRDFRSCHRPSNAAVGNRECWRPSLLPPVQQSHSLVHSRIHGWRHRLILTSLFPPFKLLFLQHPGLVQLFDV
jgi:hypothetical protein